MYHLVSEGGESQLTSVDILYLQDMPCTYPDICKSYLQEKMEPGFCLHGTISLPAPTAETSGGDKGQWFKTK